jgi:hypothetical protein
MTLSVAYTLASNERIINDLGRMWKEAVAVRFVGVKKPNRKQSPDTRPAVSKQVDATPCRRSAGPLGWGEAESNRYIGH